MNDHFYPLSVDQLYGRIRQELKTRDSIFGIPRSLFFNANDNKHLQSNIFGHGLSNPLGVAAGPHTQLAQNIIGAWLCGARYIELKTIQTLDELEIAKPCIDMQDEGYNCEWSQELKIRQSFDEYLNAWIIIHLLQQEMGMKAETGTVFNMSAGYNLEGIKKDNVQWFFAQMKDCSLHLAEKKELLKPLFPGIDELDIPSMISDNITLSTMHGCPADEIESIAVYLLKDKGLHTYVKLNPTLLGPDRLREILNLQLKFDTIVPDEAFHHDLNYPDALNIIRTLQTTANECDLQFGLKLSNTLEALNHKSVFGSDIENMYMSGRALHPITMNLAAQLQKEFNGSLLISFSGGADAFNVSDLLACGFTTVTVCSDLLKPGGVMRLAQYFEEIDKNFETSGATDIQGFVKSKGQDSDSVIAASKNLENYAMKVAENQAYRQESIHQPNIKSKRKLEAFDCISAPCMDACATQQDIPRYLNQTAHGYFDKAIETILQTNPFPSVTGMVCDHLCQTKCTRIHYDQSLLIREVKRFLSEQDNITITPSANNEIRVAVIGAGPSGLSCAYYLALAGCQVEVFEAKSKAGGMVQYAIPGFRLTDQALEKDISRITALGVQLHFDHPVEREEFIKIRESADYVYVASGAQLSAHLFDENLHPAGLLDPLEFLFNVKAAKSTGSGKNFLVIGGGNTAMDAARTAWRLTAPDGIVQVVYRRTLQDMPADQGEIKAVLEEGISISELVSPVSMELDAGKVTGLKCVRMKRGEKGEDGRQTVEIIPGSEFVISCDTIIPATGQATDLGFLPTDFELTKKQSYRTSLEKVFIGGDALRGAATAIKAIGDGRKVAEEIIKSAGINLKMNGKEPKGNLRNELFLQRSRRSFAPSIIELQAGERRNFKLLSQTLAEDLIRKESERCLQCDELCSICTTVCPNFANIAWTSEIVSYPIEKAVLVKDEIRIIQSGTFEITQKEQILNIANFCNECGNCSTFCPTSGAPYKHKPKLHLTRDSFSSSPEGYFYDDEFDRLMFKNQSGLATLSENEKFYLFDNEDVFVYLKKKSMGIESMVFKTAKTKEFSTQTAITMKMVLEGVKSWE
ncbi:MAG: putative selenate reductase subunit YgfK [Bacteroidales bacterium]